MKIQEKKVYLRTVIDEVLLPLINKKEILLVDLPFHSNIGDTLIWQGELDFFKKHGYQIIGYASRQLFNLVSHEKNLNDSIICFHGGGNLGDLYREHTDFLLSLLDKYPNNRIVVFPQTVYYQDKHVLQEDIIKFNNHNDFYFCIRDKKGYEEMKNAGLRNPKLVPDMAFYISDNMFSYFDGMTNGSLLMKRVDNEMASRGIMVRCDFTSDWPTFGDRIFDGVFIGKVIAKLSDFGIPGFKWLWNNYAAGPYRKNLLKIGSDFIKQYNPIYSTRLHGVILALLYGKEVYAIDNNYGKLSQFIDTWLGDVDELHILK